MNDYFCFAIENGKVRAFTDVCERMRYVYNNEDAEFAPFTHPLVKNALDNAVDYTMVGLIRHPDNSNVYVYYDNEFWALLDAWDLADKIEDDKRMDEQFDEIEEERNYVEAAIEVVDNVLTFNPLPPYDTDTELARVTHNIIDMEAAHSTKMEILDGVSRETYSKETLEVLCNINSAAVLHELTDIDPLACSRIIDL